MYQDLIHQMNCYTKFQCLYQLDQHQNWMIHALDQMSFLMNFYMKLSYVMKNKKSSCIIVNCLQQSFSLLNLDILQEMVCEKLAFTAIRTLMYLPHWKPNIKHCIIFKLLNGQSLII